MAERHSQGFFDALAKETDMTCHCIGCNKTFVSMQYYEHCDDCNAVFQTKETAVNDNCKKCRLNADIQKEFGVENDDKLRISIYREAWADAERENARLREENERLREENKLLNTHKARYQEEILQLEQEAETYRLALNKVRVIAEEVGLE